MTVAGHRARGALLVALAIGVAVVIVPGTCRPRGRGHGAGRRCDPHDRDRRRDRVRQRGLRSGADIGAQARLARANAHGGVAGRTIRYSGTAVDGGDAAKDTAAVQQQAGSVFAVVPAVSSVLDTGELARARVPFFGAASTTGWEANRFGFGFVGAQAVLQTRVVSPAWGVQLRSLLGTAQGSQVTLAVDDDAHGCGARRPGASVAARGGVPHVDPGHAARAACRPARSGAGGEHPDDRRTRGGAPADVAGHRPPDWRGNSPLLGFTGTVATDDDAYQPTAPGLADGLTVLVPYAPFEQPTPANRRLAADVESFAPGTALTPGVAAGYWSADAFLAVLAKVGKHLTRDRLLAVANDDFSYAVPGTVGRSTWPPMHSQSVPVRRTRAERRFALPRRRALPLRRTRGAQRHRAVEGVIAVSGTRGRAADSVCASSSESSPASARTHSRGSVRACAPG